MCWFVLFGSISKNNWMCVCLHMLHVYVFVVFNCTWPMVRMFLNCFAHLLHGICNVFVWICAHISRTCKWVAMHHSTNCVCCPLRFGWLWCFCGSIGGWWVVNVVFAKGTPLWPPPPRQTQPKTSTLTILYTCVFRPELLNLWGDVPGLTIEFET